MKAARQKGVETVINPAPAIPLPEEAYQGLGHLIVNETEAAILSGIENPQNWNKVAAVFIARGVKNVIITLGGEVCLRNRDFDVYVTDKIQGVFYKTAQQQAASQDGQIVPARKVKVVDTTAAGDTFAGAYTVAVARWKAMSRGADFNLAEAIAHANRAASMTVQKAGAQSSIPWADEVPES